MIQKKSIFSILTTHLQLSINYKIYMYFYYFLTQNVWHRGTVAPLVHFVCVVVKCYIKNMEIVLF